MGSSSSFRAGACSFLGTDPQPIAVKQTNPMPKKSQSTTASSCHQEPERADTNNPRNEAPVIATVATLKDLRKATQYTQDDLAAAMGVGQGTISRIEKRHDMLMSTLQHYVEGVGGTLRILVTFPSRPPMIVECLGENIDTTSTDANKISAGPDSQANH